MDFPWYDVIDLRLLPDPAEPLHFNQSDATRVYTLPNGRWQVTGYSSSATGRFSEQPNLNPIGAYLWEKQPIMDPELLDLEELFPDLFEGYPYSPALGLNRRFPSTVVGWSSRDGFTPNFTLWRKEAATVLPEAPAQGRSIHDADYAVGWMAAPTRANRRVRHVCVVTPDGDFVDLDPGDVDGRWESEARDQQPWGGGMDHVSRGH
jgi:hypothetical protein